MARLDLRAADQDCSEAFCSAELDGEGRSVAPPAALDALVLERLHRAIEHERQSLASEQEHISARPAMSPGSDARALAVPVVERWVYALGLIIYGAQVLEGLAKILWRTVAG